MLQPRVGDTVLFKARISEICPGFGGDSLVMINFMDCEKPGGSSLLSKRIHKILPREPQIGDTVWYSNAPNDGGTLIHIHQGINDKRKFAVVAFKGDIPRSFDFSAIRLTRECAD